jgi:DNA polymerase-4
MPISQAYRLCPRGIYLPVDMEKYARVSAQIMEILRRFTDCVEPISIDEAFLDVSQSRRALGPGEEIARKLKDAVRRETELTASVGLASSKLVAKIASDMKKPDGLVVVPPGREAEFLAPLPVRKLWGVGPRMEEQLQKVGIATLGDLAAAEARLLQRRLGTHGHDLRRLARGIDDRPVVADPGEAKSLGQEHTFATDTADPEVLRRTLLDLADGVARRLRGQGLRGRTVTLKYRDETFRTLTRAETLAAPTDSGNELFRVIRRLFEGVHGPRKVRLLGVYASGFGGTVSQLNLFAPPMLPSAVDQIRDRVANRFGEGALTRASLLRADPPKRKPRS